MEFTVTVNENLSKVANQSRVPGRIGLCRIAYVIND